MEHDFVLDGPGIPELARYLGTYYLVRVDARCPDGLKTTKPVHLYWVETKSGPYSNAYCVYIWKTNIFN